MNVLLCTSAGDDYMSACLHDGFQELLGPESVVCSGNVASFTHVNNPCARVGGSRNIITLNKSDKRFDLIIVCSAFLRTDSWDSVRSIKEWRLKAGGKILFVDGDDSPEDMDVPCSFLDHHFEREVVKHHSCLLFSAPRRWFDCADHERPLDVYCAGHHGSNPIRWDALSRCYQTNTRHRAIVASCGVGFEQYFQDLRQCKLCICPPGAGSDCMRQWEAVACGAIPVFVSHPPRIRDPWFDGDMVFWAERVEDLPRVLDHALNDVDLSARRKKMQAHALEHHTTAARALRVLTLAGMTL